MQKKNHSTTLKALKYFENDSILSADSRTDEFYKLAATGMDRKTVDKEIKKAQKNFVKTRQEYDTALKELEKAQNRKDSAEENMVAARQYMVDLNNAAQTMDLTGAEGLKQEKDGDFSYVIDGKRMHADVSDVQDIRVTPWKDYIKSKKDEAKAEDNTDDTNEEENTDVFGEIDEEINSAIELSDEEEPIIPDESDFEDEGEGGDFELEQYFEPYRSASVEKSIITKVAKKFR